LFNRAEDGNKKMIACCGLICLSCPAFLATRNDDVARAKTAAHFLEKFGFNFKTEDINCDGCLSEGGKLLILNIKDQ